MRVFLVFVLPISRLRGRQPRYRLPPNSLHRYIQDGGNSYGAIVHFKPPYAKKLVVMIDVFPCRRVRTLSNG
ncbi:hypothetical protein BDP55DRAFT_687971 [Colletotrichum godetiae]|uniref:Uncharacterized protein n=1 Tax=Colletotrichum godetiae TaxID=1209918 RepID=A0AAJ0A840_9PEZI|nr:uncharacterized protein BDP55DRAFT_687971 [Colletotrichum godetiae]KAK1656752.1 hypothetical protein BDP55DRAFT_687971 [Colletotrichum godetiae]